MMGSTSGGECAHCGGRPLSALRPVGTRTAAGRGGGFRAYHGPCCLLPAVDGVVPSLLSVSSASKSTPQRQGPWCCVPFAPAS
eukprot:COSAG02_NODE_5983_length_3891_cov_1159.797732_5_plen_83_part_00